MSIRSITEFLKPVIRGSIWVTRVVKTVMLIIMVPESGSSPALNVLTKKGWNLEKENKKVTALGNPVMRDNSWTTCPSGTEVGPGLGKQESDCTYKPCNEGMYLDQTNGCFDCPQDEWSTGGTVGSCTKCPDDKEVAAGAGTKETDCTWKPCAAGQSLDQNDGCKNCPADHWSASGNIGASCFACPSGKEVGPGLGKQESDCTWKPCNGGQYLDQTKGCTNCPQDEWSTGGTVGSCTKCPDDKEVAAGAGTKE